MPGREFPSAEATMGAKRLADDERYTIPDDELVLPVENDDDENEPTATAMSATAAREGTAAMGADMSNLAKQKYFMELARTGSADDIRAHREGVLQAMHQERQYAAGLLGLLDQADMRSVDDVRLLVQNQELQRLRDPARQKAADKIISLANEAESTGCLSDVRPGAHFLKKHLELLERKRQEVESLG